jgi:hypothetical protein
MECQIAVKDIGVQEKEEGEKIIAQRDMRV